MTFGETFMLTTLPRSQQDLKEISNTKLGLNLNGFEIEL
jgi:hypothetical protein